jgi:deoxyhypusine synthase
MIRSGRIHAITCTGANLEEDLFNLFAGPEYEIVADWARALTAEQDKALYDRGLNRVTDTCIPETVMREMESRLIALWKSATEAGERRLPGEFLFRLLDEPGIEDAFARDRDESWVLAAKETGIPIYTPGWEDSTTGNLFAAAAFREELPHHGCVCTGTEQMEHLMRWYLEHTRDPKGPASASFRWAAGSPGTFRSAPCRA